MSRFLGKQRNKSYYRNEAKNRAYFQKLVANQNLDLLKQIERKDIQVSDSQISN